MYKRLFLFAAIFTLAVSAVFPRGKQTEETGTPINNEWTLSITAFDVSELPSSQRLLGGVLQRTLAESLRSTDYRIRNGEEIAYYQDYAWTKSITDAAKLLVAKQNERDLQLYRGDPGWKYKKNIKTIDTEIQKLESNLDALEEKIPYVNPKPFIKMNGSGESWPAPPSEGKEFNFCSDQKADAFLCGKITEYHGRIFLVLRLYTLYTRSFSWEDSIIFSSEDLDNAVSELSGRFAAEISGTRPAAIVVQARPENTMILIDDFYAGRGEVPFREHLPGTVQVTAHADNFSQVSFPVDMTGGEVVELYMNLTPFSLSTFLVDVPGKPGSSVYLGSLFLGTTPLNLELREDQLSFISVETLSGETGSAVYQSNSQVRGNAEFVRSENSLVFKTGVPVSPEEKRVDKARRGFYGSYGRLWVALPVSIFLIGWTNNHVNAYNYQKEYLHQEPTPEYTRKANTWVGIRTGAAILIGVTAADLVYRIVRYLYTSRADADPIAQFKTAEAGDSNMNPEEPESIPGEYEP